MPGIKIKPSLNTYFAWLLICVLGIADITGFQVENMKFVAHDYLLDGAGVIALLFLSVVYTYFRPAVRIAEMTHMTALFLAFAAVSATASYLIVAWHRPLVDADLAASDHALGFDWLASYNWIVAHPYIHFTLFFAYASIVLQIIFLLLFLNFRERYVRGWEFMWLFMVSTIICIICSGIWPAAGAFAYYQVETDRPYVRVFLALYNGTLKSIGESSTQGIIQFPSLHMALGILFTYVTRGMRILFPVFLVLNILLIIATPAIGGHHYADLWGGAVLAAVTILIVRKAFAAGLVKTASL